VNVLANNPGDDRLATFIKHSGIAIPALFVWPGQAAFTFVLKDDIMEIPTYLAIRGPTCLRRSIAHKSHVVRAAKAQGSCFLLALLNGAFSD